MTNTIFDLVEADLPEGKEGFMELAKRAPQVDDDSFLSTISEYGKSALKGFAEGAHQLGRAMGPLETQLDPLNPKSRSNIDEEFSQGINELLPTKDKSFGANALRRGLKEAPTAIATPFASALQTLPRAIAAGFLGEGAKELGAPEWVQTAAELTAYIGPDVTRRLLASGTNRHLIQNARRLGLTDEQITPLMQSEFKQRWLSRLSPKHGRTQEALNETRQSLSRAHTDLANSNAAQGPLHPQAQQTLFRDMGNTLQNMPHGVRSTVQHDLADLVTRPITGSSLMNFWADINHNLRNNTRQLSLLKGPVGNAIRSISPELNRDFRIINDLHSRYYRIAGRLRPQLADQVIRAAEAIGVGSSFLLGITTGYYTPLVATLGEKGARMLAREMLINPRFQQISTKMVQALNQNNLKVASKLTDLYRNEISKFDPIAASKLEDISEDDLKKLYPQSIKK